MRSIRSASMLAGVLSGVVVAAMACTSTTSPSVSTVDAAQPSGSSDGADDALDAGGPLAAPFTCPVDAIQREPRPTAQLLELLRAAAGLDSIGERVATPADAGHDAGELHRGSTAGIPCSNAADVTACERSLTALSSAGEALYPAFDEGDYMGAFVEGRGKPSGFYLGHTKGDAVSKVSNPQELRALYPRVDAPAKAVIFAHAAGYRVECHLSGWSREEPDGFVLIASRGHEARCTRIDVVLFVRRDGSTEERFASEKRSDPCT